MMEKFKISCLVWYILLGFHASVFNADADTVIENFVVQELKTLGYDTPPTDNENWKNAFRSLALEITLLRLQITILNANHSRDISAVCWQYKILHNNYSTVQVNLAEAKNESTHWRANYNQATAIFELRENVEEIGTVLNAEFHFPTRQTMLESLRGEKNAQPVQFPHVFTPAEKKILKDLAQGTDTHTLKWLYYLSNCDTQYARNMREFFEKNNVPVVTFCELVGSIYEKTCHGIHRATGSKLTLENIIESLKFYGIKSEAILSCVKYIFDIQKLPGALIKVSTKDPEASPNPYSAR